MPTRKINSDKESLQTYCSHPDHNPPSHMVFQPGSYEHVCSGCKRKMMFTVNGIYCNAVRDVNCGTN